MSTRNTDVRRTGRPGLAAAVAGAVLLASLLAAPAGATTLTVIGVDNSVSPPVETVLPADSYRWLVQRDLTYHVPRCTAADVGVLPYCGTVGDPKPDPNTVSVGFHRSYMPVIAKGEGAGWTGVFSPFANTANNPADANGEYFYVSVLPNAGYSIGGAEFHYQDASVTVYVNANPIPTAQIVVQVCEDNYPINGVCDPTEAGLEDFEIILEDGGGRYGMSAGVQSTDVFGNPLGTTYDAFGNVIALGSGYHSGADGYVFMKNLPPGKFGIQAVPPAGQGFQQTSTIEGTKINDAWVKAHEPAYFAEFGPPGPHVFQAFVRPYNCFTGTGSADAREICPDGLAAGTHTVAGQVLNLHMSRPPDYAMYNGAPFPHTNCWVGLNQGALGAGPGLFVAPCEEDGFFTIPGVPDGEYQLVAWDDNLDLIFLSKALTVRPNSDPDAPGCNGIASCELGPIPAFQWFTRQEHWVFNDLNENGVRECYSEACDGSVIGDEVGIPEQAVNLRWRDGTMNQSAPTDLYGFVPFDEVFPFFSWQVAEVDYARFKATGVTVYVDNGGAIPFGNPNSWGGSLNPQDQTNPPDPACGGLPGDTNFPCNETTDFRVENGPVLLEGYQGFIAQTSVFEWGKKAYAPDENGGISGIVFYSTTRAEDDERYGAGEPWEPGIPGVTVDLWKVRGAAGAPCSPNGYPNNPNSSIQIGTDGNGNPICGIHIGTVETDSWDLNVPEGCKYGNDGTGPFMFDADGLAGTEFAPVATDCFDGIRNFNQVRPALFDGGYAFMSCLTNNANSTTCRDSNSSSASVEIPLPAGRYVVSVTPPAGYEIVRSQDKNVDFGDEFVISDLLLPAECVGDQYVVPPFLSMNSDGFSPRNGVAAADLVPANLAGETKNTCDRKLVNLNDGANAAADFFLFTEVPIAAQAYGMILDDTQNEFDPNSPQFGEKYAPPFMPVGVRDWTGREIGRTISDAYGRYNFLTPSTWTANLPQPSGMGPNMLTSCMNANLRADGTVDPQHNPQYSQFCYTFQYMPGATVYLDTPVVPVAAFTGAGQFPLDCEYGDGIPRIYSVTNGGSADAGNGPFVQAEGTLRVTSMGVLPVPNPEYDGVSSTIPKTILRDYGFACGVGGGPTVTIGGVPQTVDQCSTDGEGREFLTVSGVSNGGQLVVTRADGGSSLNGVTVTLVAAGSEPVPVLASEQYGIQNAIEAAADGDVISVAPGVHVEMVIMWKPVRLQGWGEGSEIYALKSPAEALQRWRDFVDMYQGIRFDLLPGQETGAFVGVEPLTLFNEEGAGVIVLGQAAGTFDGARIDGLTISGADTGGGIIVNGYAPGLEIANNRVLNNSGFYGGGIRLGHPTLIALDGNGNQYYPDAMNHGISIHNNYVGLNGGLNGAGAGVTLGPGSNGYQLTDNYICGNFNQQDGGGVAHFGLSDGGLIARNAILFNESFFQGATVSGAGLLIAGQPAPLGQSLSPGTGDVIADANLILGNSAEAGDGGGIQLSQVNGQDASNAGVEYQVILTNNMIANNIAALAGGGISIQDAADVVIAHNTVVHNDSTATAGAAFPVGSPTESAPQDGAGLIVRPHGPALAAALGGTAFTAPDMEGNIFWQNRQFIFAGAGGTPTPGTGDLFFGLCPTKSTSLQANTCGPLGFTQVTNDSQWIFDNVAPAGMTCVNCIDEGDESGSTAASIFVADYFNGNRDPAIDQPEQQTIFTSAAFDEGGNFIRLRFGPLTRWDADGNLFGDYHLSAGLAETAAADHGGTLASDFDGDARPTADADIGADEVTTAALKGLPGGTGHAQLSSESVE